MFPARSVKEIPMNARIRFGNELDILKRIYPAGTATAHLRRGRTVLTFSKKLSGLPDEPEFAKIMDSLELQYEDHGGSVRVRGASDSRLVEVLLPIGREQIIRMAKAMTKLGAKKAGLGREEEVLFIDHTIDPAGRIIEDFDALLAAEKESQLRDELRNVFGLDDGEIRRFFRDFPVRG